MTAANDIHTLPLDAVYDLLVCEFTHWDICLSGLIENGGRKQLCNVVDAYADDVEYSIHDIAWDEQCDEYLEDYRVAYKHWFHTNGRRLDSYGNWPLDWFHEKWGGRNPIVENSK